MELVPALLVEGRRVGTRRRGAGGGASDARSELASATRAHARAIACRAAGRFAAAESACRQAIASYEAAEGRRHPDLANALVELGLILEESNRSREAVSCHWRALAVIGDGPLADPDVARLALRARIALAGLDRRFGAYAEAERGYETALAETRRRFGRRDPFVPSILNNLGVLRKTQGRYREAAAIYRRALRLVDRGDHGSLATLAHNLGTVEHALGRYAHAEPHARRAVRIRSELLGARHPAVAADLVALAAILEGRGRLDEAALLHRQALRSFTRVLGAGSLEVGIGLANLASVEQQRGRLSVARTLHLRALAVLEALLGRRHVDVALTVNNLAMLERDDGNLDRAAVLFRRASATFSAVLGEDHPHALLAAANRRAVATERALLLKER